MLLDAFHQSDDYKQYHDHVYVKQIVVVYIQKTNQNHKS